MGTGLRRSYAKESARDHWRGTGVVLATSMLSTAAHAEGPIESDVVSVQKIDDANWEGTKTVHEDGSVDVFKIEKPQSTLSFDPRTTTPPGSVNTFSRSGVVKGCSAIPDSGGWKRRINCRAYSSKGSEVSGFFRVDYSVKSGAGRIDRAYSPEIQTFPGVVCSDPKISVVRKVSQGKAPAVARMTSQCSFLKIGSSYTAWMEVNVRGSAWVTDKSTFKE